MRGRVPSVMVAFSCPAAPGRGRRSRPDANAPHAQLEHKSPSLCRLCRASAMALRVRCQMQQVAAARARHLQAPVGCLGHCSWQFRGWLGALARGSTPTVGSRLRQKTTFLISGQRQAGIPNLAESSRSVCVAAASCYLVTGGERSVFFFFTQKSILFTNGMTWTVIYSGYLLCYNCYSYFCMPEHRGY